MPDATAQIEEFKRQLGVTADAELAAIVGYQRSTIAQWKKRGSIPAKARQSIEVHIDYRRTNEDARSKFSKLAPSKRQFAKAVVVKFLVETTLEEDGDLEPDSLLFRAIEMDNFELAAARLLEAEMAKGARDLAAAYRAVLGPDLPIRLGLELTAMMRAE